MLDMQTQPILSRKEAFRKRLHEVLATATEGDTASRICDIALMALISLNVLAVMLETVPDLSQRYGYLFHAIDVGSVLVFTAEYLLRVWACTAAPQWRQPVRGRLRFAVTPMVLVDLAAILPFYAPLAVNLDLRMIRAVRLFRMFRVFKMSRYSGALQTLGRVLNRKKEDLAVMVFVVTVLLIFSSSLMYIVEHDAQPTAFSSIPAAMWWGVATLTTVGYGDIFPVTLLGKVLGAIIAVLGIGMFALPAGLLGSGFIEEMQRKKKTRACPHCGKTIDM